ncbi:MAG TPA: anti-phage dCTP deaminase [Phycisphaerae bacterium]|nr:anti-phage dCTP deaminase [Phycisphaerae bacterium]HNU45254.1 anti-phage dCTP deaminase [Phycisphaerae bacterium]
MNVRFTGSYEEFREKLQHISGVWRDLNPNQKQLRTPAGGVLNWYPSTGSLTFQGNSPGAEKLRDEVIAALTGTPVDAAPGLTPQRETVPERHGAEVTVPVPMATAESGAGRSGLLQRAFSESELVFALIGAVGTELQKVRGILDDWLRKAGYSVRQIRITQDVIPKIVENIPRSGSSEYDRLSGLMDAGNEARATSGDNSILALGAAAYINSQRSKDENGCPQHVPRCAYVISSLKHPDEVGRLREIYPQGFYLIGVHADEKRRFDYLTKDKSISDAKANELIDRDENEHLPHGQRVADTFHLSDFFVRIDGQDDHLKDSVWRILELLFGNPYVTPTFDEYAMFLAFAASLSSADLSRQVGAVVAVDEQVVATGANDCPRANGGRYWPVRNPKTHRIEDQEDGRDYMRGEDSNKVEQQKIIDEILDRAEKTGLDREKVREALDASRIRDLTEFGRVVHAEMDALLSCGRIRAPTQGGTLYCTTFPCHNCAKHIVGAGIHRVVFIEPYEKSKAAEFHSDSIQVGFADLGSPPDDRRMVCFEPFVGVGPRRFFDLFSIRLGSGYPVERKNVAGRVMEWKAGQSGLRLQMLPASYLDLEFVAGDMFNKARSAVTELGNGG